MSTQDLFEFASAKPKFAVIGNPVSHTKSPKIHNLFGRQLGIALDYRAVQVDSGGLVQAVRNLQAGGFKGLNITVPYKEQVSKLVDVLSDRARVAGAVNTVRFESDETIFGDNTDGGGLVRDLENNLKYVLEDARILVVGAGGAVRGILGPLLSVRPHSLAIANRTVDRAVSLSRSFSYKDPVDVFSFAQLRGKTFDIVINGTSSSLNRERLDLPNNIFASGSIAYDMMYADSQTPFTDWALEQGAEHVTDGLGMLVEQAAGSFELWHGVYPDTSPILRSLRPCSK